MELMTINREEKKRATKQKITDCALKLFAEQGYEATTVNQIAEHADIAKGTFFNYFETKEELLCDFQFVFATEEISKLQYKQGPIIPLMREVLMEMVRRLPAERLLILAKFQTIINNSSLLELEKSRNEEFKQMLTPVIKVAQDYGEITGIMPAEMIAELAVQTYDSVLLYWGMGLGDEKLTNQMALTFELFIRGISP